MSGTLEHIYSILIDRILSHSPDISRNRNRNMTSAQYRAMIRLKENENIVIKKADKGSSIVIQNKVDYTKEGLRQLSDTKFYKKIARNITLENRNKVQELIDELFLHKEISEKCYKFLSRGGTRTSVFYMLPKIHKNVVPPPGRPIVSSVNNPTEKISMMLNITLQPCVGQTKSYIKDTSDFIQKISSIELEENDWLFTMDVTSLYTNIPHDEGINCIRELLNSKRQNGLPRNDNLIKMLELVLKLNNFTFNSEHYLQINGTAMGTRVAPTYANLFMDSIERKYIYTYSKKPIIWFRFIDDVWGHFQRYRNRIERICRILQYLS